MFDGVVGAGGRWAAAVDRRESDTMWIGVEPKNGDPTGADTRFVDLRYSIYHF